MPLARLLWCGDRAFACGPSRQLVVEWLQGNICGKGVAHAGHHD